MKTKILSLDGGGMRGLISLRTLMFVENWLQEKYGSDTRLADHFDLIAGTSTGGIIASLLTYKKKRYTVNQIRNLYVELGQSVFKRNIWRKLFSLFGLIKSKYSHKRLNLVLNSLFENTTIDELEKVLITSYDIKHRKAVFFSSKDAKWNNIKNFKVKRVLRATSAAPTFFPPTRISSVSKSNVKDMIDGGMFANNPALCAYAEARNKFPDHPTASEMCLLSLGTGESTKAYSYKKAKSWGMARWLIPILDIFMSSSSEVVDYQLDMIFSADDKQDNYLRINGSIDHADESMDNASSENISNLEKDGDMILAEKKAELISFLEEYF